VQSLLSGHSFYRQFSNFCFKVVVGDSNTFRDAYRIYFTASISLFVITVFIPMQLNRAPDVLEAIIGNLWLLDILGVIGFIIGDSWVLELLVILLQFILFTWLIGKELGNLYISSLIAFLLTRLSYVFIFLVLTFLHIATAIVS
jgi:hypothetical protein